MPMRQAHEVTPGGTDATNGFVVDFYDQQDTPVAVEELHRLAAVALSRATSPVSQTVGRRARGRTKTAPVQPVQVDVTLVDPARMTELNGEHMGADGPTDVLAFPMDGLDEEHAGVPSFLGDVVICPAVAAGQAAAAGHATRDEMELLLVHGILHLLGHDHAQADERRRMFGLTDAILSTFRSERPTRRGSSS